MKRRNLLKCLGLGVLPFPAWSFGKSSKMGVAQLDLGAGTLLRPTAWARLLYEVQLTTSIETAATVVRLDPESPELFSHPFSVLVGDGRLPLLTETAVKKLRDYLTYGGFLFIDDSSGLEGSPFDGSVRSFLQQVFPTHPLVPLPSDHSLYRAFFLIDRPLGRVNTTPWLEGITLGETTRVVYCRNDLSGALARSPDGRNLFPVTPGGENQRREAVKLGINLMMYALTSNYKKDQAHVRQLMLEGRLE
jgi:hypothetical protein